ncbi:hypothetical protein B0H14DRAFT_3885300 [Mycena olivaceomarginata]|nr:hypothetical protein B0H14DRAFT_3885300 [Mycena olivaceomarginata]
MSRAGDSLFTLANTVADTPPFRSTLLCCSAAEWVGLRRDGGVYLGTISATPPATDAEDLGVDDFDVGSALHAPLEDAACRVQLPHTSQRPNCSALTNPTQLPRNTPLRWAAQMDAMADRHGAGTMAGEQWGYGARALGPELRRK